MLNLNDLNLSININLSINVTSLDINIKFAPVVGHVLHRQLDGLRGGGDAGDADLKRRKLSSQLFLRNMNCAPMGGVAQPRTIFFWVAL